MSHSEAHFKFSDGTLLYGEYNGTTDVMLCRMYPTREAMLEEWRGQEWKECVCGQSEPCVAVSWYGGGFEWDGSACRKCGVFCGPHDPFWDEVAYRDYLDDHGELTELGKLNGARAIPD